MDKRTQEEVIGITIKTCNRNNQAMHDIGMAWARFMQEELMCKIPNKVAPAIYALYYEYEGDHMEPYSYMIGCPVEPGTEAPKGFKKVTIPAGEYSKFTAKGKMPEMIGEKWQQIWQTEMPRSYIVDFEIYDERAHNPEDAIVDIYVGVLD